jgi:plasmid stability protein
MPVNYEDDDRDETESESEESTGRGLRSRLEAVLQENRQLSHRLERFEATEFLREKGFTGVKPEQLVGQPKEKWEELATQLQSEYDGLKEQVAREILRAQGITGDDLEEALKEFVKVRTADKSAEAEARQRVRQAGQVDSGPAPVVDTRRLDPLEMIRVGLKNKR